MVNFILWLHVKVSSSSEIAIQKKKKKFQIGKGIRQGYILLPCLFNLNAEYIMRNAGLDETQAGI